MRSTFVCIADFWWIIRDLYERIDRMCVHIHIRALAVAGTANETIAPLHKNARSTVQYPIHSRLLRQYIPQLYFCLRPNYAHSHT